MDFLWVQRYVVFPFENDFDVSEEFLLSSSIDQMIMYVYFADDVDEARRKVGDAEELRS